MIIFKRFSLSMLVLVTISVFAGPVSRDAALQKARKFMPTKQFSEEKPMTRSMAAKGQNAYYIFNADNGGFVIVSGDDRTEEILGYSDKGEFTTEDMPENLRAWLGSYADQIAYLQDHPQARTATKTLDEPAIEPLLGETAWGQEEPYNNSCPLYDGKQCITGCTATAMAQIMYYYKWPTQVENEIPEYVTRTHKIKIPAIPSNTPIDWDNILHQYGKGGETDIEKRSVADLMFICGASISTNYSLQGSGSSIANVATALRNYFNYDASISYIERSNYRTEDWNKIIYDELSAGRPVEYGGSPINGSGHAFVIDGYYKDDLFHVNWGWRGRQNGYFLLSVLNPNDEQQTSTTKDNYNCYKMFQDAIIGIKKDEGSVINDIPHFIQDIKISEYSKLSRNSSGDFGLSLSYWIKYVNKTIVDWDYEVSTGLFDKAGNLMSVMPGIKDANIKNGEIVSMRYSYYYWFGADLSDGEYYLKAISRVKGRDKWNIVSNIEGGYLKAIINSNELTIETIDPNAQTVNLSVSITPTGELKTGNLVPITIKIENNGDNYREHVYFFVDEIMQGGCLLDLDAGQSKELFFTYYAESGKKSFSLRYREDNKSSEYPQIYSTTYEIQKTNDYLLKILLEATNAQNGIVTADVLRIKAVITNEGLSTYDGNVAFNIYGITGGYDLPSKIFPIKISGEDTKELEFELGYLESGKYAITPIYYKNGSEISGGNSCIIDFNNTNINNPYVIYNEGTLTFYFDNQKSSHNGIVYDLKPAGTPGWKEKSGSIQKVVFNNSFKDYCPYSTYRWFADCSLLTEIIGIENLITSNITNMQSMFSGCISLTNIDLSNFNTSIVLNMDKVFYGCNSLESLVFDKNFVSTEDVNTSNIFTKCESLKTIEFKGDIPAQIKSNFFEKVGTEKSPATLVVPKEYMANYQAKFDGNKFYGGYFIMSNNVPNTCNVAGFLATEPSDQLYEITGMLNTISGGPENSMPQYGFEISDYTGQMSGSLLWSANDTKGIGFKPGDIVTLIGKRAKNDDINYMDVKSASIKYKVNKTSIADFFTKEDAKDVYYMVSGTVEYLLSSILYCNLRINDGKGNSLYVYRCSPGYGASLDDSKKYLKKANYKVGDKVTFIGYKETYKESVELMDAFCFAHEPKIYTYKDIDTVADMIAEGGYTGVYDVNGDGKINVADIVAIVNMILGENK